MKRWIHGKTETVRLVMWDDYDKDRKDYLTEIAEEAGLDKGTYAPYEEICYQFNADELRQLVVGLASGLDVKWYADPAFNWHEMYQIRRGLEQGLDVSVYADPQFSSDQMYQIRRSLEEGLDASIYAHPEFRTGQMEQIRKGLEEGLDVSLYADPRFDDSQMSQIRSGLLKGIDVSVYCNPRFSASTMSKIKKALFKGDADLINNIIKDAELRQNNWPSRKSWLSIDSDDVFETWWDKYLQSPESEVNDELGVFPEPSRDVMVIHDISGQERNENGSSWAQDFSDWSNWELRAAASSKSASSYQKKYRQHIKEICGI